MSTKKDVFKSEFSQARSRYGKINKMVVAIKLPTGATELIVNTEQLESKFDYYCQAYNDDMRLKNNTAIEIADWMFV